MANSKRKCKHCKHYLPAVDGIKTPSGFFCSITHAYEHARELQEKAQERQKRKDKAKRREQDKANREAIRELNRRDLRWQHKQTQKAFNRMRVLEELLWFKERGLEPTCISCGNTLGNDQWCCGHFKTVGAQGGLRYNRLNTFLQHNRRCNKGLSGDIAGTKTTRGYRQGLIDRFGEKEGQEIIDYCEQNTAPRKWHREELEEMRRLYNRRIRDMERRYC